ncbi:12558_t:CDS:2, partial [Dentiscutata erythropus]
MHRQWRVKVKGNEKINLRRMKKNTQMVVKKKRRKKAVEYLLKGGDEKLNMYPQKDILQILNDSGFHSEEWKMTDEEYEEVEILKNASIWMLNMAALRKLKWKNRIVLIYDPDTTDQDDDDNNSDDNNDHEVGTSSKKRKRKDNNNDHE